MKHLIELVIVIVVSFSAAMVSADQSKVDIWSSFLQPKYFPDVELLGGTGVIELKTPYRAEDAAVTPVSVKAGFP